MPERYKYGKAHIEYMAAPFYYLLHPRPAYVIGSGKFGERINFMAASWVSPVSEEPERVMIALDKGSYTYELIKEYGEFTVNVLPMKLVNAIYCVGSISGRERDKASRCGLTPEKGRRVSAPVVKEAVGFLECKVYARVDSGDTELILGDVLHWEADKSLFGRYGWDLDKVGIPLHLRGKVFVATGKVVVAGT